MPPKAKYPTTRAGRAKYKAEHVIRNMNEGVRRERVEQLKDMHRRGVLMAYLNKLLDLHAYHQ